jgi:geranylgeranyl transferase type-2 subunit beta
MDLQLLVKRHAAFVQGSAEEHNNQHTLDAELARHLAAGGAYWCIASLLLLQHSDPSIRLTGSTRPDTLASSVLALQHKNGGFGGGSGEHSHAVHTLWALQALMCARSLHRANLQSTSDWLVQLQQSDGWFAGDEWLERDARHTYCVLASLVLVHSCFVTADITSLSDTRRLLLEHARVDVDAAAESIAQCQSYAGGFAAAPGLEPHAGHAFTCVMALALCNRLDLVDADALGFYLCERQCPSGGFNGRPEKLPDVCYSWWLLSSLIVLKRAHWVDLDALERFMLNAQDSDDGGFSDRPGNAADSFHTYLALASLSLLQHNRYANASSSESYNDASLGAIVPHLALPKFALLDSNKSGSEAASRECLSTQASACNEMSDTV